MKIGKDKIEIKSRNIPIMYASEVIGGMLFFLPILALYYEKSLFTVTNVAIVFAVEAFCVVLFEIPTGAIADLFGRKKSIIFANIFVLFALIFLSIGTSMTMFVLYAVFNAFARSLTSGTCSALIYDSLKEENKEQYFKKIIGNLFALWPLGASLGSILGGYMAAISLRTPVFFTFIPITIALIITFFLKESNYEKEQNKNILKHMLSSSKIMFQHKQLIILAIAGFLMFSLGETIHRLDGLFFEFKQIPIVYFGYISAFIYGMSSLGHYLSHDISAKLGNKTALIVAYTLSPLLTLIATFISGMWSVIFFIIPSLSYGIKNPIIDHLINSEIPSKQRATILSINNFVGQLGFAIVAPFIGYFSEIYNINTAIQISSIILFSVPVLFLLLKTENKMASSS
jgi:MFS family permease